jgi:MFS family permease
LKSSVGALFLSAEIVIGGLLPIFILEYAGVDPTTINKVDFSAPGGGINLNPFAVLPPGVIPPDLGEVTLLATIPLITNGIASYLMVPLSIAVGRRPMLLFACTAAWAGGIWAAFSTSLQHHIAARGIMGLGAGAVEALIPLIIQDMMFIHQRNKAMAAIVSSQSLIIVGLGIASPYIAANHDWRWLYYITSGLGLLAWGLLITLLPETRWTRSKEELAGQPARPLPEGQDRPDLDLVNHSPRTIWSDLAPFQGGLEWREAGISMLDTLRTTLFPSVLWSVAANSIFVIVNQAAAQLTSFALLAQGWRFEHTGFSVLPFFVAAALVYFVGGPAADRVSLFMTRHNGGAREPEHQLPNLILPFATGIGGSFLFGVAAQNGMHWSALLAGWFLIIFAFLTTISVINVYMVESYPQWAGPVLVNVSSLRLIVAFFLASQATLWVLEKGAMMTFALYAWGMVIVSLGIPALYFTGKKVRRWTSGKVMGAGKKKHASEDSASERSVPSVEPHHRY